MQVGDARVLDRLVRGRAWIAIVAVGLLGIVFMQVSMLRLNAGISTAVSQAESLERQNSTLRQQITQLGSDERIQAAATQLGMTMPAAGDVRYLDARRVDAKRAARAITPPDPVAPVASTTAPVVGATATQATPTDTSTQAQAATTDPTAGAATTAASTPTTQETSGQPTQDGAAQPTQDATAPTTDGAATADTAGDAVDQAMGGAAAPQA